eukprot:CAMPEP_0170066594 /NCGR_PEP_ID=MMETSP0019_2-20121128/6235_1 /TAXON_ID=98059 /ORGANISM="Dinobryon sp., Strain UTEXLB2267" /LENGTH=40 /DNA_ID= /DNA_START= /DNA_END= /DNA_ORIENTATION=
MVSSERGSGQARKGPSNGVTNMEYGGLQPVRLMRMGPGDA